MHFSFVKEFANIWKWRGSFARRASFGWLAWSAHSVWAARGSSRSLASFWILIVWRLGYIGRCLFYLKNCMVLGLWRAGKHESNSTMILRSWSRDLAWYGSYGRKKHTTRHSNPLGHSPVIMGAFANCFQGFVDMSAFYRLWVAYCSFLHQYIGMFDLLFFRRSFISFLGLFLAFFSHFSKNSEMCRL